MANMIPFSKGRIGMPSLLGWDPARLFDELLNWNPMGGETLWSAAPVDVRTDEDHVTVTVDMPGVDHDDLDLTYEAGTLTISGKRGERQYRYAVALGTDYDPESIEADLDKGVLTVSASKRPEAKPKKIALKSGGKSQKSLESGDAK